MKTCIRLSIIAMICVMLPLAGRAFADQAAPGSLTLDADYAAFRILGDTARDFVEIYYDLHRNQLKYEPADSGYVAYVDFWIKITDDKGAARDTLSWRRGIPISKLSVLQSSDYVISDLAQYFMKVGRYVVDLDVSNGGMTGHASFPMDLPFFNTEGPTLSTIEMAYQIEPDSVGAFIKGGYRVLPNPSRRFMHDKKVIYLYAEAYDLDTTAAADTAYAVTMDILNPDGQVVRSIPPSFHRKPGHSAVIRTGFSIATMKPGQYVLRVTLADGGRTTSVTKDFAVLGSREMMRQSSMASILKDFPEADRIADDKDAARFRTDIVYIVTGDELKLYDSLNLTGKANFQRKFWGDRNPDPSSSINAFEIEHYRRLKYANSAFGSPAGFTPGWKTDRGRVYILYGEPTEVERHPSSISTRSWEQWWYTGIEGGVYFIFVDFENADQYTLIHSTKKNEVQDVNWERKVRMTLIESPGQSTDEQANPGMIGR